jgi:hypothetical protein
MQLDRREVIKERDSLLEHMLYKIQNSPVTKENLLIRGGAAMHFFYSSPRYSGDIDTAITEFDKYRADVTNEMMSKIDIEDKTYFPKLSKDAKDFLRISYAQVYPNTPTAKLEVDRIGAPTKYTKTDGKFAPIIVEEPSEIYADKIVATFHRMQLRNSIKPSDLFDLEYITNILNAKASKEDIKNKAKVYDNFGWNKENLDKIMDYIRNQKNIDSFRKNLEDSMMPDFFKTQNFDSEYFNKTAEHFSDLNEVVSDQADLFQQIKK